MKKINLTFLILLFICAIPSLCSAKHTEQCRKMLEQVDPTTNQYVYYEGRAGQTPLKNKIRASVWKLYQDLLTDEMKNDATLKNNKRLDFYLSKLNSTSGIVELIGSLSYLPNDQPESLEIARFVNNFCEREIKELTDIYSKTSGMRQLLISSKTGDCKRYVAGDESERIVGLCHNVKGFVSQLEKNIAQRAMQPKIAKAKAEMGHVFKFRDDTEKYVYNPEAIKAFYGAQSPTFTLNDFLSQFNTQDVLGEYTSLLDYLEQRNFAWDQLLDTPAVFTLKQGKNFYYIKTNLSKIRLGDYVSDLKGYKQQKGKAQITPADRTRIVREAVKKFQQEGGNKNLQYDSSTGTYSLTGPASLSFQLVVPKEIL